MGVRFPGLSSTTITNSALVTTAETIICTLPPISLALDFQALLLFWWMSIGVGASTTAVVFRLRRSTLITGTPIFVSAPQPAIAASTNGSFSGVYPDTPGAVAGQQYVLTAQQTGATGNGGIFDVCLAALGL